MMLFWCGTRLERDSLFTQRMQCACLGPPPVPAFTAAQLLDMLRHYHSAAGQGAKDAFLELELAEPDHE